MALFNYATRELSAKIVYYGPGLSGKTTNIEKVHELLKPGQKGKLISLPTETDRTLFFDFLPVQLGRIKGFNVRFHLYTVPGQVFYNATRRLVLQGVDGVVFVADSQQGMKESNLESLRNLEENLATYGKRLDELPFLIQFNKRDLKKVQSIEEMDASLNRLKVPTAEASALTGQGVIETLSSISRLVFQHLRKTLLLPGEGSPDDVEETVAAPPAATAGRAAAAPPVEELEEISELEYIPESRESAPSPPPPSQNVLSSRFGEGIDFPSVEGEEEESVPDEIDIAGAAPPSPPPPPPGDGGAGGYRFEELDQIDVAPPTPDSLLPPPPTEGYGAPLAPGELDPAAEPSEWGAAPPSIPQKKEPPRKEVVAPPVPSAPVVPSVRVETEAGSALTFLRFDDPSIDRSGNALLPMVFLDGDGNTVRVRLRLSMDER